MLALTDKDIKSYTCILCVQNVMQRHKSFKKIQIKLPQMKTAES